MVNEKVKNPHFLSPILFITDIDEKDITVSPSAVYLDKAKPINSSNIVNETGLVLNRGDKIVADARMINSVDHIVIKRVLARQQPIARTTEEYVKLLRIFIDDSDQRLDFDELNSILEGILGIKVNKIETILGSYHLIVKIGDLDHGTKKCPFWFLSSSCSYPLKVNFPKVSDATKNYLKMMCPNGKVTDTRIFAFRLIHFLLHKLGYHDHMDKQKIDDYRKFIKALHAGDPKQVPHFDPNASCFGDWEALHFIAVQTDLPLKSFNNILCKHCKTTSTPVGVGFDDLEQLLYTIKTSSDLGTYFQRERDIFYVIDVRKDGLILNLAPYKSKKTIDIANKSWFDTILDAKENLNSIFVPNTLFLETAKIKRGDKILLDIDLVTRTKNANRPEIQIQRAKTVSILKRDVKIINPNSLFSRILPLRLSLTLKIGPETDMQYMKKVAKIVNHLTNWRVRIDTSSYEDLKKSFGKFDEIAKKWKDSDEITRGNLVFQIKEIIDNLPKRRDVEDRFEVNVYVFPEKYPFFQDVFGTIAQGEALHRSYAVVSIYPKTPTKVDAFCEDCQYKPMNPFSEAMTALFVVHEIMHITSGLSDHHDCSVCIYNKKEMQSFRRYFCEECIREGNNQIKKNCLMSYECMTCIAIRYPESPKNSLSKYLCQQCNEKVLPADRFVAKQASRMNALIYQRLLMPDELSKTFHAKTSAIDVKQEGP